MSASKPPIPWRAAGRPAAAIVVLAMATLITIQVADHLAPETLNEAPGGVVTYTLEEHFEAGSLVNVEPDPAGGALRLVKSQPLFNFIWVSSSDRGTVVKIDTLTGAVVGEYRAAPENLIPNPSRTTVDRNGGAWVGNRNPNDPCTILGVPDDECGSIVHIGLFENDTCVDRNGNGRIDTSNGLDDILPWPDPDGVDSGGGVSTAEDECILHHVRVSPTRVHHVSLDQNNDVWVGGTDLRRDFNLIDGDTGEILRYEYGIACGGHGGLVDPDGILWSTRPLLRWDPSAGPLATTATCDRDADTYGICMDKAGNIWTTQFKGNAVQKRLPNGTLAGTFPHGNDDSQSCAIDHNEHIWVTHSVLNHANTVGHLDADGTFLGRTPVGEGPTGVAVDPLGKVWVTNFNGRTLSRIDPIGGPPGLDGETPIGLNELTTEDLGGRIFSYGDMTGSLLRATVPAGTWTIVHDSQLDGARWYDLEINGTTPADSALRLEAATSSDGLLFTQLQDIENGAFESAGRYLKVVVTFTSGSKDESPILHGLSFRPGVPQVAAFSYSPPTPTPLTEVTFSSLASDAAGGVSHAWEFGDGATATGQNVRHRYDENGVYEVCLTLTAGPGLEDTQCQQVTIHNAAPRAAFSWTPAAPTAATPVVFLDESNDPDGVVVDRSWRLGDGTTGVGPLVSHRFDEDGLYNVCLVVTDDDGGRSETCQMLEVGNEAPLVAFDWSPKMPRLAETVRFTDASRDVDGTITGRAWEVGGARYTTATVEHRFAAGGSHRVCLEVTDNDGASARRCEAVAIQSLLMTGRAYGLLANAGAVPVLGQPGPVTVADTGELRTYSEADRAAASLSVALPHAQARDAGSEVELDVGASRASAWVGAAEILLPSGDVLEMTSLQSLASASCEQSVAGSTGEVWLNGKPLLDPLAAVEPNTRVTLADGIVVVVKEVVAATPTAASPTAVASVAALHVSGPGGLEFVVAHASATVDNCPTPG